MAAPGRPGSSPTSPLSDTGCRPHSSTHLLTRLQRAHLAHVPWDTVDILAARPEPIDELTALRLVSGQRSGYCFPLNAAFAALLTALGFEVHRHRAGVQTRDREPRVDGRHIGLRVVLPEGKFLVDAGLGDMPWDPIPLVYGVHRQGAFSHRLGPSGGLWKAVVRSHQAWPRGKADT